MNNQNPINGLLQLLNSGGNPQQIIQTFLQKNPQANTAIQQLQNMANGQNPKDFAMQLAKQRGIDPKQIEEIAKKMGLN